MRSISSPGRIGPLPVGTRCRPALPGDLCHAPSARGVDQLFWATRALVRVQGLEQLSQTTRARARGPAVSIRCPGQLRPVSKVSQVLPDIPSDSCSCRCTRSGRVDQLSRVTWARVRGPVVSPSSPGTRDSERGPAVSTSFPGTWDSERGPEVLSSFPGTRDSERGPAVSTSFPRRLGPVSNAQRCRPAVPDNSSLGPRSRGVDQLPWMTHAQVRGPAVSIRCPGRLGPVSECPRARSAVPGNLGPLPWACGVDQLSRTTRFRVRVLEVSTSCPARLMIWSRGSLGQPPLPGDLGSCLTSCSVNNLSWATWARVHVPGHAGTTSCPG